MKKVFLLLVIIAMLLSCSDKNEAGYLAELKKYSNVFYKNRNFSKKEIEELKAGIKNYKKIVEKKIEAAENIDLYYKMLGLRYMEKNMFNLALESFSSALYIQPENALLHYQCGLCAARLGKGSIQESDKKRLFGLAEEYYKKALFYESNYSDALYAISVLYIFELNKVFEAEEYLQTLLAKESMNVDAMFLLARVYVQKGDIDSAIDLYEQIADTSKVDEKINKARENRQKLLEGYYGKG